ncbi:MAG: hypothetical protein JO329_02060 [Planctomycetaceae bacterium]|nr:hypothetical protein [Planctomycetaceae bacterium]
METPSLVQIGPASAPERPAAPHSCGCGHKFCPRKVHSVAGVVFGLMMIQHLAVNALALRPGLYQAAVGRIQALGWVLPWLSLTLIVLPLAVHVVLGATMLKDAGFRYRTGKHHRGGDLRYLLQRITAVILLLFIALHVLSLTDWGFHLVYRLTHWEALQAYGASGLFHPDQAYRSTSAAIRTLWDHDRPLAAGNLAVMGFYLLAIWATAYHLANGLSTAAMVWNLTRTPQAERRAAQFCAGLCIATAIVGTLAWSAFILGA